MRPQIPMEKRFWKYVKKTPACWVWIGSIRTWGYGQIATTRTGISVSAHRYSWEIHNGKIPKGLFVLHTCDNRVCVNPSHLWLGTQKQNMADCLKKGRKPRGESHGMSILKEKEISEIRKRYIPYKIRCKQLAKEFGVSDLTIRDIVDRKSWKHIP